jgi:hypothetical protein
MSPDTELGATLERALDDLPSVPAAAYLLEAGGYAVGAGS